MSPMLHAKIEAAKLRVAEAKARTAMTHLIPTTEATLEK